MIKMKSIIQLVLVVSCASLALGNPQYRPSRRLNLCSLEGFECEGIIECCDDLECINQKCSGPNITTTTNRYEKENSEISAPGANEIDITKHANFYLLPNVSNCGISQRQTKRFRRVAGGRPAKAGEFPWMVQIVLLNTEDDTQVFVCGASLINSRYVLTAAHCLRRLPAGTALTVVNIGAFEYNYSSQQLPSCSDHDDNWRRDKTESCSEAIDEIIVHENYMRTTSQNDVALIRLENPIDFDERDQIKPICLPFKKDMFKDSKESIQVAGWGYVDAYFDTKLTHTRPKSLNKVSVRLLPKDYCDFFYSNKVGKLEEDRLCAISDHEAAVCKGDSGSPVVQSYSDNDVGKRFFQIGIVSIGTSEMCGRQGDPYVLPNVAHYMPWILDNIRP